MANEPTRSRARLYAVALFVVLVVYPLSIGPMAWLVTKFSPDPSSWLQRLGLIVYRPLVIAAQAVGLDNKLVEYTLWWGGQ